MEYRVKNPGRHLHKTVWTIHPWRYGEQAVGETKCLWSRTFRGSWSRRLISMLVIVWGLGEQWQRRAAGENTSYLNLGTDSFHCPHSCITSLQACLLKVFVLLCQSSVIRPSSFEACHRSAYFPLLVSGPGSLRTTSHCKPLPNLMRPSWMPTIGPAKWPWSCQAHHTWCAWGWRSPTELFPLLAWWR